MISELIIADVVGVAGGGAIVLFVWSYLAYKPWLKILLADLV